MIMIGHQVPKSLKPLQGLKQISLGDGRYLAAYVPKSLKPLQGLKPGSGSLAGVRTLGSKKPETLTGIETFKSDKNYKFLLGSKKPETLTGIETSLLG